MSKSNTGHIQIYSSDYKIRSYEVDQNGDVSIANICNYFQESAGLQAQELQFDISDLFKQGLTWILYQLHVQVIRFPGRWETVTVETWPSSGNGLRAYRDYKMLDEDKKTIAIGLSHWMMLDIKKRRPVKIPDELMKYQRVADDELLDIENKTIDPVQNNSGVFKTEAGRHDLDMNMHVNNVRYIDWVTGYRDNQLRDKKCVDLKIQFLRECLPGDRISIASEIEPSNNSKGLQATHSLIKNDKIKVANSISYWV